MYYRPSARRDESNLFGVNANQRVCAALVGGSGLGNFQRGFLPGGLAAILKTTSNGWL